MRLLNPNRNGLSTGPLDQITAILLAYVLIVLYLFYKVNPAWADGSVTFGWVGFSFGITTNGRFPNFLLAGFLAGVLGSFLKVITTFLDDAQAWKKWQANGSGGQPSAVDTINPLRLHYYFLRPLLGGGLAVIFMLVVKAGWYADTSLADGTGWGLLAMAGLVGLFAKKATEKLKSLLEQLVQARKQSPESAGAAGSPGEATGLKPGKPA